MKKRIEVCMKHDDRNTSVKIERRQTANSKRQRRKESKGVVAWFDLDRFDPSRPFRLLLNPADETRLC